MTCSRSPNQEVAQLTFQLGSPSKGLSSPKSKGVGLGSQPGSLPKEGELCIYLYRRGIPLLPSLSGKPHPAGEELTGRFYGKYWGAGSAPTGRE